MKLKRTILTATLSLIFAFVFSQNEIKSDSLPSKNQKQEVKYKHSIGASLFMVSNFFPEPADYYLLTYGYQHTQKDRFFIEFNTWKFSEPLGTYDNSKELYPGYVREYGIGVGYQRFLWKGAFASAQGTPFLKQYFDEDNNKRAAIYLMSRIVNPQKYPQLEKWIE